MQERSSGRDELRRVVFADSPRDLANEPYSHRDIVGGVIRISRRRRRKAVVCQVTALVMALAGTGPLAAASTRRPSTTTTTTVPSSACPPSRPLSGWAVALSSSGRQLWLSPLPVDGVEAQVAPRVIGRRAYFFDGGVVNAFSRATGQKDWHFATDGFIYGAWPWAGGLVVYSDGAGRHIRPRLFDLDRVTGKVLWSRSFTSGAGLGVPVATTDGFLAWTSAGTVQALRLGDGERVWQGPALGQYQGALAAAATDVFVAYGGRVVARAGSDGRQVWSRALPGISSPAMEMADGLLLVMSGIGGTGYSTALFALAPSTGQVLWSRDLGTPFSPYSLMAAGPEGLALQGYVSKMFLLAPLTGKLRWYDKGPVISAALSPALGGVVVVAQGPPGQQPGRPSPFIRLIVQRAGTGRPVWSRVLSRGSAQAMAVTGGTVVVTMPQASIDGPVPVAAYRLTDGKELWAAHIPAFVTSTMMVPRDGGLLVDTDPPDCGLLLGVHHTAQGIPA